MLAVNRSFSTSYPLCAHVFLYKNFFYKLRFLCTQKVSTLLESVSVAGRPAVRMHDNFRKECQIVVKFSTQFSLINISVEFEDEPDWTSPS
jgi:hypothetical protein